MPEEAASDEHKIIVTRKNFLKPDKNVVPEEKPEVQASPRTDLKQGSSVPKLETPEKSAPEKTGAPVKSDDEEIVNELAQQAAEKRQASAQLKAEAAQAEKIEKLVNDKTYFVSIGKPGKNITRLVTVIGIVILLVVLVAGIGLALN